MTDPNDDLPVDDDLPIDDDLPVTPVDYTYKPVPQEPSDAMVREDEIRWGWA